MRNHFQKDDNEHQIYVVRDQPVMKTSAISFPIHFSFIDPFVIKRPSREVIASDLSFPRLNDALFIQIIDAERRFLTRLLLDSIL